MLVPEHDVPPYDDHSVACRLVMRWNSRNAKRVDVLERALESICDEFDATVRHFENRGKGGQQVSFHGDFANVAPSTIIAMRRWSADLREVLAGTHPACDASEVK